ncbi:MAG: TlpA family protein disulfide reductase [Bacteroidales bacterium]|nr:TlpA family protein disulfide reductase [Bacteroidales bacterium]
MKTPKTFTHATTAVRTKLAALIAIAAAGTLAACSPVSDTTKLTGTITDGEGIEEVNIASEKFQIDTLVPVVNGKFAIDLPTDPTEIAFASAGYYVGYFILDGTNLKMTLGEETTVTSNYKKSLQNKYNAFEAGITEMTNDFQTQLSTLLQSGDAEEYGDQYEEIFNAATSNIVTYIEQTILDNKDNAIAGVAVNRLNNVIPDEELLVFIGSLSDEMQESIFVAPLRDELETRLLTAEGMPFRDFTIPDSDGKTVSLSDYVGKGKYVLVDFWASWCQPCKDEVPHLKDAYSKFHRKGLEIVSVAIADEPQDSKATAKELGMTWNLIINAGQIPAEVYGFASIPQIMLFGPDGTILKKGLRGEEISEEIGKYIK